MADMNDEKKPSSKLPQETAMQRRVKKLAVVTPDPDDDKASEPTMVNGTH